MNPTPSPTPPNGVAVLMAEIERIAQELRATNKRPLPATEDQVKALLTLAERERPLTLQVNSKAVATLLLGQVDEQAKQFQTGCDKLIGLVDDRTDYLVEQLTARLAAVQAAEASLAAAAQRIPREVRVNWLSQWQLTAGFYLGAVAAGAAHALGYGHVFAGAQGAAGGRAGATGAIPAGPGGAGSAAARGGPPVLPVRRRPETRPGRAAGQEERAALKRD